VRRLNGLGNFFWLLADGRSGLALGGISDAIEGKAVGG